MSTETPISTTDTTVDTALDTPPAAGTLPLAPGRWTLDPNHFRVGFAIRHLGVSKVRGQFLGVTGELVVGATPAESSLRVVVDLASIDTGNPERDAHVRSSDILDVAVRPTMAFHGTGLSDVGEHLVLEGELTIGEVSRPVSFDVEFGGVEHFPADGRLHAGFEGTGEIRRKDFGLDGGLLASTMLGDVVKVELDVQFVAVDGPSPAA